MLTPIRFGLNLALILSASGLCALGAGVLRRAVVYIQPGTVSRERQVAFCFEYCEAHAIDVVCIVPAASAHDAIGFVTSGGADLVVSAFAGRARPGDLRDQAHAAQVFVEYARPPVVRREVRNLLEGMYRRSGGDVSGMARWLGESTEGLRAALARLGIVHPRGEDGSAPDSRE